MKLAGMFVAGALLLLLLGGVASARITWQPSVRTPMDMQVAICGRYGYQPPITNVYGNEQVNIVDSWSSWTYGDYSSWIQVKQTSDTAGDIVVTDYQDGDKTDSTDSEDETEEDDETEESES